MRKTLIYSAIAIATIVALLFQFPESEHEPEHEGMTNPQLRAEWEYMLLADPATGLIPVSRSQELAFAKNLPVMDWSAYSRTEYYEWKARGPFNFGGRTRGFAMDVVDNNVLIAGSISGGIYRSTDKGATWAIKTSNSQNFGITCLIQDKRAGHENTWYAGSGEDYSSASQGAASRFVGNGILKSNDGGLTWEGLSSTQTSTPQLLDPWDRIWRIALDPNDSNDVVFAAIMGGIMRSSDGGQTWTKVLGDNNSAYYTDIVAGETGVFYAMLSRDGTPRGVFRSTNGTDWTNITPANFGANYNRIVCGIDPSNENDVYFLAETSGRGKKFTNFRGDVEWVSFWKYTYIDGDGSAGGGFWEDRSLNLPRGPFKFDDLNVQGGYNMLVNVKPNESNTVIIGGTNLFRSTTAFADSTHTVLIGGYKEDTDLPDFQIYDNHHPDQHWTFFDPADAEVMYSSCDGGVFRTSDVLATPVVWESLNNGYNTTQFYTCAIDHATEGSDELMGGLQDNGTFYTNSQDPYNWTFPFSYDGAFTAIANGGEFHVTSKQLDGMFKVAIDENGQRTGFTRIDPIGGDNYYFIHPWAMDPNNSSIIYLPLGSSLWRNDSVASIVVNDSANKISTGWVQMPYVFSGNNSCVGVSTANPANRVYVGTASGRIYKVEDANDINATYTDISNFVGASGHVNCISVDPKDANHAVAIFSNYNVHSIHYTRDGGNTWYRAGGNLEAEFAPDGAPEDLYNISSAPSVRWAEILHVGDDTVYLVGTSVGLFGTNRLRPGIDRASDTTIWKQLAPDEIGNAVVMMIDSRESDGLIAVATHGAGMYTTHIPFGWGVTGEMELKSDEISVFPNPTHQQVNIISKSDIKSVQMFDMHGHKVKSILPNGNHCSLPVDFLSAGIYIIYVETLNGSFMERVFVD